MEVQQSLAIPGSQAQRPELSLYTCFRKYLSDFYNYKVLEYKGSYTNYNYKTFSAAADIRSPNYLKLIIDGERNLSPVTVKKFAKALGLDRFETEEFALLVSYGQAADGLERNQYLQKLSEFRMKRKIKSGRVKAKTAENAPSWLNWVMSALVDQKGMDFKLENLKKTIGPQAKEDEIKKAFESLIQDGSLVQDWQTGEIRRGVGGMPNPEEFPPELIRKLQAELIYLGMESLLYGKPQEKEFGSLTVCLTEDEFEKLKFELRHLRKRIYKDNLVAREKSKGDRVYQLNIQLYPITK